MWLLGHSRRKKITIDKTKVSGTLYDFPVLVSITNDPDIGLDAQSSGYDIRFTESDGQTLLNYEREFFSITDGICSANFWVKIPTLSSTDDTIIYIYYGDSDALDGQNASAVWDSNYTNVYHLSNGTSLSTNDSTINNNSTVSGNMPTASAGKIDGGATFDAVNDYILGPNIFDTSSATVSAWIYLPSYPTSVGFILGAVRGNSSGAGDKYLYIDSQKLYFLCFNVTTKVTSAATNAFPLNEWVYIVGTVGADGEKCYINGVVVGTHTNTISQSSTVPNVLIGGRANTTVTYLAKTLDEVRFSTVQRSDSWCLTEYNNQSNPSTFYTIANAETDIENYIYPIIQYTEENEMDQAPGTTLDWLVQIRDPAANGALATVPLTNVAVFYTINKSTGISTPETQWTPVPTISDYSNNLTGHLITIPSTIDSYSFVDGDSLMVFIDSDQGIGALLVKFRTPKATLISDIQTAIWGATTRTITEAPYGVALTTDITALNNLSSSDVTTATESALSASNALRILDIIMSGTFTITTGEAGAFTCAYTSRTDLSTIEFSVDGNGQRTATTVTLV